MPKASVKEDVVVEEKVVTEEEVIENITEEDLSFMDSEVRSEPDNIGVLVSERRMKPKSVKYTDIKERYEVTISKPGEDDKILAYHLPAPPGIVKAEMYYPCREWRITQESLDNCDYWPQWKPFPIVKDGQPLRSTSGTNLGQVVLAYHYIVISVRAMTKEENGRFFDAPPLLGSVILERQRAKETLSSDPSLGASRRRAS